LSLAALLAAALLAATPLGFFHRILRQDSPFAAAPRLAGRMLTAKRSGDDAWRRYEGERSFVELGPFAGRTPQKIVLAARFSTRAEAIAYAAELLAALPVPPTPRPPLVIDEAFSYRGAIVLARRPVGLELDLAPSGEEWRVTAALIAGGSRLVVPIPGAGRSADTPLRP
jgi:hypothetical protein